MPRRPRFPPTFRQRMAANEAALKAMSPTGELPEQMQRGFDEIRPPPPRKYERRRQPNEPSEAQTLKAGLEYLERHPRVAACWRQNAGSLIVGVRGHEHMVRFGPKGIADVIGYLKGGRFLAVEFKAPHGKLMPHQREFLDAVNAAGGLAFMARSIDDIKAALE